jgi:hypothetical protein
MSDHNPERFALAVCHGSIGIGSAHLAELGQQFCHGGSHVSHRNEIVLAVLNRIENQRGWRITDERELRTEPSRDRAIQRLAEQHDSLGRKLRIARREQPDSTSIGREQCFAR